MFFLWSYLCLTVYFSGPKTSHRTSFRGIEGSARERVTFLFTNCGKWRQEIFQSSPIKLPHIALWPPIIWLQWVKNCSDGAINSRSLKTWQSETLWNSRYCTTYISFTCILSIESFFHWLSITKILIIKYFMYVKISKRLFFTKRDFYGLEKIISIT